ncbi:hypothetical protein BWQ96_00484 [Gracilariopsis chorda]|uniref:Uncharacterized protein n=1 Tax=Gracilariopsis chorda TaxID=448386 RepID=A0A2V3J6S2_9FLOR|nr:hypothetical protein BWQ96_00484 [Gracilariopsis chorda]|eukprot:PXF49832.1 hypothetical protein BWQ96_00484 [Gracilariopsis chorda]
MHNDSNGGSNNAREREQQLDADLELLRRERNQIIAAADAPRSSLLRGLHAVMKKRLQLAADHRDLQLANLHAAFVLELQQATNELQRDKRALRARMLAHATERRRRLYRIRGANAARRRRRGRGAPAERGAALLCAARMGGLGSFAGALERQGVLRVALTPDEVSADLGVLLDSVDVANRGCAGRETDALGDGSGAASDRIHSSKGTLHYRDVSFEKGDQVTVFTAAADGKRSSSVLGVLMSVNAREIHVRAQDGTHHRVAVAQLRTGKLALKRAQ